MRHTHASLRQDAGRLFVLGLIWTATLAPALTHGQGPALVTVPPPAEAVAAEKQAYVALWAGNIEEALKQMARAVELGSRSRRLYGDYAALDPARAEAVMSKAIALWPDDRAIRLDYVRALLAAGKGAAALTALSPLAMTTDGTSYRFYYMRASAYLQTDRVKDAKEDAARMAQATKVAEEVAYAERFMRAVNDYASLRATGVQPTVPALARGGAPTVSAGEWQFVQSLVEIDGRITNMICSGVPVLEVASGTAVVRLVLDNPQAVLARGGGKRPSFQCGRQNLPVTIGYEPAVDKVRKTIGKVRSVLYLPR